MPALLLRLLRWQAGARRNPAHWRERLCAAAAMPLYRAAACAPRNMPRRRVTARRWSKTWAPMLLACMCLNVPSLFSSAAARVRRHLDQAPVFHAASPVFSALCSLPYLPTHCPSSPAGGLGRDACCPYYLLCLAAARTGKRTGHFAKHGAAGGTPLSMAG